MAENRTDHGTKTSVSAREQWTGNDPARRVRVLVAGALASGAFVTGALSIAPQAMADCTAAGSGCSAPSDSGPAALPSQAEINEATVNYLLARGEFVRLQDEEQQARREHDEAAKAYGKNLDDPRYVEKYRAWTLAQSSLEMADEKARAASDVVTKLDKRVSEASAKAAAAKKEADDREAAKWGGPSQAEIDDANRKVQAAKDESARLKAIFEEAKQKTIDATDRYNAGHHEGYAKLMEAENLAFRAYQDAEAKAEAASEVAWGLKSKAAAVAKQRADEEQKREAQKDAEFRDVANWGFVTQDQLKEANDRGLALRDEGIRLQAIVDKAQGEAWQARQAYGLDDPRYKEKQRIFDEAVRASTEAYHREWEAGNYFKSLNQRNDAANARRAEDDEARRQQEKIIAGPTPEDLKAANDRIEAARKEAIRLQSVVDRGDESVAEARWTYGVDDPHVQEAKHAAEEAAKQLQTAYQTLSEARKSYEKLTKKADDAAVRRAAREEAERQAAKDAAANPEAPKKAEAERLSAKAAQAWLELKHSEEFDGRQSAKYQEKLKAYLDARKLVKPSTDEKTDSTTKSSDSSNAGHTDTPSTNETVKTATATATAGTTDASTNGGQSHPDQPTTDQPTIDQPTTDQGNGTKPTSPAQVAVAQAEGK